MRNLCAMIPEDLYEKVSREKEKFGMSFNQYTEKILRERFEGGNLNMTEKTRTIAVQVSEELFQKIKEHLKRTGQSQKEFLIGLLEAAVAMSEQTMVGQKNGEEAENQNEDPGEDEDEEEALGPTMQTFGM